jgi:drug/metabolite transporter (DMT)-like permease
MSLPRGGELLSVLPLIVIPMLISVGQLLFKQASQTSGLIQSNALLSFISNPFLATALVIYFLSTLWWVVALRSTPLSYAYVFMALSFVYVPLFSWLVLRETVGWKTILGTAFIVLGIVVATMDRPPAPGPQPHEGSR